MALLSLTLVSHELHKTPRFLRILYQQKHCHPGLKGTEKEVRMALKAERWLQRAETAQAHTVGLPPPEGVSPGSGGDKGQSIGPQRILLRP